MKLNANKNSKQGIAMTEYLVILAIVAIGSILVVGQFGKQIKNVFQAECTALSGTKAKITAETVDTTVTGMNTFGQNTAGN